MITEGIIGIEDEAFKIIMAKLERVDDFVRQAAPIINEYNEYKKNNLAEKRFLKSEDAARLLGVSRRTLERYKADNKIPFLQKGGLIQYDYFELIDYKYNKKHKNSHTNFVSTILSVRSTKSSKA